MLLKKYFPGKEELKEARYRIEYLGSKRKLTDQQKSLLRSANVIVKRYESTRRKLAIAGFIGMAGLFGAYVVHTSAQERQGQEEGIQNNTLVPSAKAADTEKETDVIVEKAEKAFTEMEKKITPLVESNIKDEKLKTALLKPFAAQRGNREYSYRNLVAREKADITQIKSNNFSYAILELTRLQGNLKNVAALYNSKRRALLLREKFDPENSMDQLIAYHELVHAVDDEEAIIKMTMGQLKGYDEIRMNNEVTVNTEAKAYALQIEMLNIFLSNDLKKIASAGQKIETRENVIAFAGRLGLLDANDQNIGRIRWNIFNYLLSLADRYYPQGISANGEISPAFYKEIFNLLKERVPYLITDQGDIVKMSPETVEIMENYRPKVY